IKDNEATLVDGAEVIFTSHECVGDSSRLYMNYLQFPQDVAIGDNILIDDGKIRLTVLETNRRDEVKARVVNGGKVSSRKGVNLPHTRISLPSLTPKDLEDLEFALQLNVDWIGLSFVRKASDILELKEMISRR